MPILQGGGALWREVELRVSRCRDRWRYYQASECLKGCQFRNQEYAESAQGCRKALKTGSWQHRAACAEAEAPLQCRQ